jgi:hypothetical protein
MSIKGEIKQPIRKESNRRWAEGDDVSLLSSNENEELDSTGTVFKRDKRLVPPQHFSGSSRNPRMADDGLASEHRKEMPHWARPTCGSRREAGSATHSQEAQSLVSAQCRSGVTLSYDVSAALMTTFTRRASKALVIVPIMRAASSAQEPARTA